MLNYLISKVIHPRRRVAVTESLDVSELEKEIQFHIRLTKKEGKTYFSETMIMSRLIDDLGWPVKSDYNSIRMFEFLFNQEVSNYLPKLATRNAYSFQLKQSPTKTITSKILK